MNLVSEFQRCWLIAIFGCILFTAGTIVLFWNEGRAVHKILSLDEALEEAITVNAEEELDSRLEGRIVHFCGPLVVGEPLTEPEYGIQVLAVKLRRRVQMYQWVEESVDRNYVSSVSSIPPKDWDYYYTMEWRYKLIDSGSFYIQTGHRNPEKFPIESQVQVADHVFIGKFELGEEVKDKFTNFIELTSDARPEDPGIKLHLGMYYHCNDLFNPEIGDIRVHFSFTGLEGEMYTVVGRMEKGKIVPYETRRKSKILFVYRDELSLLEVFKKEHYFQRLTTWSFRFVGWILLFFGATCTASLLNIILSRVSFLSSLAPDPTNPVSANVILSFSLALAITSVAWVFHRPWIGAGLLFAALSPFFYFAGTVVQYQRMA